MIRHLGAGNAACITITLIDGLVLARSVFNHSINYRSAVLFGHGEAVTEPEAKMRALRRFMERQLPGRWDDVRVQVTRLQDEGSRTSALLSTAIQLAIRMRAYLGRLGGTDAPYRPRGAQGARPAHGGIAT